MPEEQQNKQGTEFRLERYKFILGQQKFLNENIFRYLALFQVLATAIVGSIIGILISFEKLSITPELAKVGIRGLLIILGILGLFVVISMLSGIFSWFDYRKEEVSLLNDEAGPDYRQNPSFRNFWRWNEVYLILFTIATVAAVALYVESRIIPILT
jgi:hypothetical protein